MEKLINRQVIENGDYLVGASAIFGRNLRAIRKENGIRQEEVAERLKITGSAVSRWESGDSLPDSTTLDALAQFLGVPVWKLFFTDAPVQIVSAKHEPSLNEALKIVNAKLTELIIKKRSKGR